MTTTIDALVELHITTVQSGDGLVGSTVADAETGLQKVDVEFDLTDAETLVLGTLLRFSALQVKGDDAKLLQKLHQIPGLYVVYS